MVEYGGGAFERMNVSVAQQLLLDEESAWGAARTLRTVATTRAARLPDSWDLTSREGLSAAMGELMPGAYSDRHLGRLVNRVPGGKQFQYECVPTGIEEVRPLLESIRFDECAGIFDPWCGTGGVARAFREAGHSVFGNDANPACVAHMHRDALQPGTYREAMKVYSYEAIVASPWFAVLDVALPLATRFAPVVAFHVPGHYVTDATAARTKYLAKLQEEGRLALLLGLPRGPMGRRCVWVCVFATREWRERMLKPVVGRNEVWLLK
ncbi:hypothetical protein Agub_g12071 [Astrephomene gubernaculifera]|uniref:Uncharacterized protein n=1 Tax=Astrephomene gubernaculifera TaxID=47775 RepID=A0AAD3DXP9_9CHLO|nr:hypothetical protein Agub_g10831 [Astrephomene gubernaculifera]GFR49964.1 hypothetical protein Agub_g12071 [Astrephomene gubernaculifera]